MINTKNSIEHRYFQAMIIFITVIGTLGTLSVILIVDGLQGKTTVIGTVASVLTFVIFTPMFIMLNLALFGKK